MSKVIYRSLSRELMQHWLVITLVLWLVLVVARFSLYLGQAASGQLPADLVFGLLLLKSAGFFAFLLPLSFFLALLLVLARYNRDYESVALAASGFGPLNYVRALAIPTLLAGVITAILTLIVVPVTADKGYALRAQAVNAIHSDSLAAGRFIKFRGGDILLFADRMAADGITLENIFIALRVDGHSPVITAARASRQTGAGGAQLIVLENGYRYEGEPGNADYRILQFDEYRLRVASGTSDTVFKWDSVTTRQLWSMDEPGATSELQKRLSRPLSLLLLALVALALGQYQKDGSRFGSLLPGILFFIIYFNLLETAGVWVSRQQWLAWPGVGWIHLLPLALVGFIWLHQQQRMRQSGSRDQA